MFVSTPFMHMCTFDLEYQWSHTDKVSGGESSIPMTTVVSENHDKVHEQLPPDNEQAGEFSFHS